MFWLLKDGLWWVYIGFLGYIGVCICIYEYVCAYIYICMYIGCPSGQHIRQQKRGSYGRDGKEHRTNMVCRVLA